MPAYRLVQNTAGLFRGKGERGFKTWRYTLEELVSFLAAFKASRPHDTIYAILGLASDFEPVHVAAKSKTTTEKAEFKAPALRRGHTGIDWSRTMEQFEVDYEKPVLAVFKEFLHHAIEKSKSLDIICRPWAPTSGFNAKGIPEKIDLPSWIPTLAKKPFQPTSGGNMVRYNPDPLVGPAIVRHKLYSASGALDASFAIDLKDSNSRTITVDGFVLDEIEEIWDTGNFGNVPGSWLEAGQWRNKEKVPPDELWRTLVGDRNGHGHDPDPWYPLVFQSTVKERGLEYGFETARLIHESPNAQVAEVFRRIEAVVWNRRLIRTKGGFMPWLRGTQTDKGTGALGLAPSDTRKGDLICIIFGCSVPLILRRTDPPKQDEGQQNINDINNINGNTINGNTINSNTINGNTINSNTNGGMNIQDNTNGHERSEHDHSQEQRFDVTNGQQGRHGLGHGLGNELGNGLGDELDPGLKPVLELGLESRLESELEPKLESVLEPKLESVLEPKLESVLEPKLQHEPESGREIEPINGYNKRHVTNDFPSTTIPSTDDTFDDDREFYKLVGECYVDHMMDGEAIAYFKDKIKRSHEFTLL
jgi:hypothetical protein